MSSLVSSAYSTSTSTQKMSGFLQKEIDELQAFNSADTLRRKERQEMIMQVSSPTTPYQKIFSSNESTMTARRNPSDFIKIVESNPVQNEKSEEVESYKQEILQLRSRILELEDKFKNMDGNQTSRSSQASKGSHYKSSSVYQNPSNLYKPEDDFILTNKVLRESHGFSSAKSASKATKKRGASAIKSKSYRYQTSDSEESASENDDLEFELARYSKMTRENLEKKDPTKNHQKKRKLLKQEIKQLNLEYDEDKALLIKERVRGQELAEKIRKTMRIMEKMEQKLLKASKIEGDYKRLFDSYGKSENLREHQTSLIRHLKSQLPSSNESCWIPQKKSIVGKKNSKNKYL